MQIYHEQLAEAHVFHDGDEALKWLGIDEDSGHY